MMTNPEYPLNVQQARAALADPEAVVEAAEDDNWVKQRWNWPENGVIRSQVWTVSGLPKHIWAPTSVEGFVENRSYRLLPKEGEEPEKPTDEQPAPNLVDLGHRVARLSFRVKQLENETIFKLGGGGDE